MSSMITSYRHIVYYFTARNACYIYWTLVLIKEQYRAHNWDTHTEFAMADISITLVIRLGLDGDIFMGFISYGTS
jgi:hypothetical protein